MKRLAITVITCLLFLTGFARTNQYTTDPIYLASVLIDKPGLDEIRETLLYNNFTDKGIKDGKQIFESSSGTIYIPVSGQSLADENEKSDRISEIMVETDLSIEEIRDRMQHCGYKKTQHDKKRIAFEKGTSFHPTRKQCIVEKGKPVKVTFLRISGH